MELRKFGSPPLELDEWFDIYARSCFEEAKMVLWPFSIKYKWRGEAFKEAAKMARLSKIKPTGMKE